MFIGIAGTIPNLPNLPGQGGGGGVEVLLEYDSSSFCKITTPNLVLPTVAEPAGGTFSYTGTGILGIVPYTGLINIADSDSGSYTITYSVGGSSSNFPIAIGNEIILSITTSPGATICTGDTETLTANASGGSGGFTYSWSTGATSQSIDVTTSGNYIVTVTDSDGCSVSAAQQITASTNGTTIASIDNDAAMTFNGLDQYIELSSEINYGTTNTLSFWVNSSSTLTKDVFGANTNGGYLLKALNATDTLSYRSSTGAKTFDLSGLSSNPMKDGDWHHIAFTRKSSGLIQLYVDGDTVGAAQNLGGNTLFKVIGANYAKSVFFDGKIDEVAIWDSALSSCDIKGIYEGSIGSNAGKAANLLDANTTIPAPVYWNRMGDS